MDKPLAGQSEDRQKKIGIIAVVIGGAALLSIVTLLFFSKGKAPTLQNHRRLLTPRPPLSLRGKVPTS